MTEFETVLTALSADPDVRVVVVTGSVAGYFVAHADLDDLIAMGRGETVPGDPAAWNRAFALIESMDQPVVAAINGQAWGGGCELALACTFRLAAASAHFSQPEVAVGLIPGAGGTQRLQRLVGPGIAADIVLTGRVIESDEALRIGLVNAVLTDENFLEQVRDWVAPIARHPAHAVRAAKRALVDGRSLSLDEALRVEGRLFVECLVHPATAALEQSAADRERSTPPSERAVL